MKSDDIRKKIQILNEELEVALENEKEYKVFPKELNIYVHHPKWSEYVTEWAENECGWEQDSDKMRDLAYIGYEVKLTYKVYENGRFEIIKVDDRDVV